MSYYCDWCAIEIRQPDATDEVGPDDKIDSVCNGNDGDHICIDDTATARYFTVTVASADHETPEHFHRKCIAPMLSAALNPTKTPGEQVAEFIETCSRLSTDL